MLAAPRWSISALLCFIHGEVYRCGHPSQIRLIGETDGFPGAFTASYGPLSGPLPPQQPKGSCGVRVRAHHRSGKTPKMQMHRVGCPPRSSADLHEAGDFPLQNECQFCGAVQIKFRD